MFGHIPGLECELLMEHLLRELIIYYRIIQYLGLMSDLFSKCSFTDLLGIQINTY